MHEIVNRQGAFWLGPGIEMAPKGKLFFFFFLSILLFVCDCENVCRLNIFSDVSVYSFIHFYTYFIYLKYFKTG